MKIHLRSCVTISPMCSPMVVSMCGIYVPFHKSVENGSATCLACSHKWFNGARPYDSLKAILAGIPV